MTTEELTADLTQARDLIQARGLAKACFGVGTTGQVCTVGAVMAVTGDLTDFAYNDPRVMRAVNALR